jgi:hypothetical protein
VLVATNIDLAVDLLGEAHFKFLDPRIKDYVQLYLGKNSDFLDAENTLAERQIMEEN